MSKCCICGTVRDCEKYLDKILKTMEQVGSIFDDYKIILYYDVSRDKTLDKLKLYKDKNNRFDFYVNPDKLLEYRTHRISKGRNYCLNYIRENCSDYEYFIMMDCDNRCERDINLNLLNAYLLRNDWDSLSFDHPDGYYDDWALSIGPYFISKTVCKYGSNQVDYINRLIRETPRNNLISCYSAFNGFAIYRTPKFLNCFYDGRLRFDYIPKVLLKRNKMVSSGIKSPIEHPREDCEHRFFHYQAIYKNKARIRISPTRLFR